ncbi:large subunit ribosomal protein L7/L12, partial [Phenoliferia sp. Uapishka_3]
MKEVPTFKMISQSVLIDRMKINGSLARVAISHLTKEGLIKPLIHHNGQLVYNLVIENQVLISIQEGECVDFANDVNCQRGDVTLDAGCEANKHFAQKERIIHTARYSINMSRFSLVQNLVRARPTRSSLVVAFRPFASTSAFRAELTPTAASAAPPPPPSNLSPKISAIVDQIATLTLLEAAELVDALKTKLNIVDIAMPASAPAASGPAAAAPVEEVAAPKEKTVFNVTLTKIDAAQKAKAIREVKAIMPSMNLVEQAELARNGADEHLLTCGQAKKFVESLPKVLKENATKEEAEKLQKALVAVGAEVTLD